MVTSGGDPEVLVWDLATAQPRMKLASDTNGAVALCPKGAALAIADSRGNITLWNVSDGQRLSTLGYHRNVIWAGGFSASGDLIATACGDNSMRLWDAVSGRLIDDFRAHWGAVWDLKFSPGDESLTTLGSDGLVRFWNLAEILKMSNGVGAVRDMAVSPDSNEAAIATSDKLFVLSLPELQARYTRTVSSESNMWGVAFVDHKTLITAGRDHLRTWDVSSGNIQRTTHHGRNWAGLAVLGSNDSLAVSHGDRSVVVRSLETGDIRQTLPHEE